ncbi:uncharacterized protein LOC124439426 [Xenia sp. Carnegie-2017]|uniref:uncharacterized protein LOC124439426 n=1 Tax=Xenia sp. Carnegie-2017 TaxID=2897299 RepID=UPI001F04660F|nr:uncharacterized protein LOC124439426 [Xenia sp. Carnegie-2017]
MRKTAVVIMADQSRLDKIAAARKKLKKFQLKKAPLLNSPKIPDVDETEDKRHENKSDVQSPENLTESLQNGSDSSPSVLKIKQMLKQLNGFSKQEQVNTDDPIITEIGALERRNSDLERNLTSHKRNNEQLGNQVNEQRKQIILLQEQIRKERTELANRQLLEQRSLKEQLEVCLNCERLGF